jgi:hypothetical protein
MFTSEKPPTISDGAFTGVNTTNGLLILPCEE